MLAADLRRELDNLWTKFWAGGLPNPLIAIDQINLLLFLRRLQDVDAQQDARASGRKDEHTSIFAGKAEKCRWAWWSNLPADQMYAHVQQEVVPWMRGLAEGADEATKNLVRDANLLIPSPGLLAETVATIDRLKIGDRNVDVQGDLYEYLLRHLQMAGQLGQFRTPRHIIRAIVEMVDPKLGETVIDPACGTAGFLIAAHQHVLAAGTSSQFLKYDEFGTPEQLLGDLYNDKQWTVLRDPPLTGYDIDSQMARIATMNLILHGVSQPKIQYANALGKDFSHAERARVILANPPFAGSIDKDEISADFKTNTKKTELLFLELFLDLLEPGGRAGVIVPDSVLFSAQKAHVVLRKRLLEKNTLHAVISLPPGTFKPYTNSSCGVLLFQKGGSTQTIWMYYVRADGYSLDDKREPIGENDLPDLVTKWPKREESERSFNVSLEQIEEWDYDLSVETYAPFEMPALPYRERDSAQRAAAEAASALATRLKKLDLDGDGS